MRAPGAAEDHLLQPCEDGEDGAAERSPTPVRQLVTAAAWAERGTLGCKLSGSGAAGRRHSGAATCSETGQHDGLGGSCGTAHRSPVCTSSHGQEQPTSKPQQHQGQEQDQGAVFNTAINQPGFAGAPQHIGAGSAPLLPANPAMALWSHNTCQLAADNPPSAAFAWDARQQHSMQLNHQPQLCYAPDMQMQAMMEQGMGGVVWLDAGQRDGEACPSSGALMPGDLSSEHQAGGCEAAYQEQRPGSGSIRDSAAAEVLEVMRRWAWLTDDPRPHACAD